MAYLWFIGYEIDEPLPDHSILTKSRIRFGVDIYREFFHQIVRDCVKAGLVDGDVAFVDSTLIDSAASYKGGSAVRSRALVEELDNKADSFVENVFEQNTEDNRSKEATDTGVQNEDSKPDKENTDVNINKPAPVSQDVSDDETKEAPAFERDKVKLRLAESSKDKESSDEGQSKTKQENKHQAGMKTNQMLASPTDPEADIVRRGKKDPRLAYKGHFLVDGGIPRVITAARLTPGMEHDAHLLWPLLAEATHLVGTPHMLPADMGYSTADAYYLLKVKGIAPAIPKKPTSKPNRDIPKSVFIYNKDTDTFTCPEGKLLSRSSICSNSINYRSKKKDCKGCPIKEKCITGKAKTRTVTRGKDEPIFEWAACHLQTLRAKEALRRRKIWPESAFADAKNNHGMGRAKYRGRWKVEIQVLLTAAVINIKKLVKYGGKIRATGVAVLNRWQNKMLDRQSFILPVQLLLIKI